MMQPVDEDEVTKRVAEQQAAGLNFNKSYSLKGMDSLHGSAKKLVSSDSLLKRIVIKH